MRSLRRLFGRTGCRSGAVTVETAIVIVPFLFLTMMTLEIILIEFYQAIFAKCVQDTARQIRTGQSSSQSTTTLELNQLVTSICNDTGNYSSLPLPSCSSRTAVIVNVISSGVPAYSSGISGGALVGSSLQTNGTATSVATAYPGACNLVVFQAFYQWPILIPGNKIFLNSGFTTPSYLFASASAFQDEPPQSGGQCSGLYN